MRPLHERLPETTLGTNQWWVETSTHGVMTGFREVTDAFLAEPSRKGMGEKRSGMDSLNFDSEQKGQA